MNRRKFIAMMAAGAVVTAEGIWMPGQKLISIPKPAVYSSVVTLGGFHDFQAGDYIEFSEDMTATEVEFRHHEYAKQLDGRMTALRYHVNGLYRVTAVVAGQS